MDEIKYHIIRKFSPSVLQVKIPKNIVKTLNDYIDEIIKDEEKIKKLNAGEYLVGDVTQEFRLEIEFMQKSGWGSFLTTCVNHWIEKETGKKITKFKMKNSWIVRQFKNEYNPTHWHGGHVSGVGYLKVPKKFGDTFQKSKTNFNGYLQLIHGSKMFLCNSTLEIKPEVGDFYFFPNYLMHTVFPFSGTDEERRSVSFNAYIDAKIYDVYGN